MNASYKRKEINTTSTSITTTNSIQNTIGNTNILSKQEKLILLKRAEEKVKTYLIPCFVSGLISKEYYKEIMKKCVEKVYDKTKIMEVKDEEISQMVDSYVNALSQKY